MRHRPWPYAARLAAKMADSSLLDTMSGDGLLRVPRTGGIHVSQLLRILYPVKANDITETQLSLMGLAGLAFEDRAELALIALAQEKDWPWHAERPGELTSPEGVKGSPDVLLVPKLKGGILREASLKCTWKSSRGLPLDEDENMFPDKFAYYIGQCKMYCHLLNTMSCVLVVYFVCGDYNRPLIPQFLAWELDFSHQEIEEEWDACMSIAGSLGGGQ
jgi:hypothetical protein